ncbi:TatD family hydrolase [Myroides fluvii]|uniref:TatD family hydrolase n=1 Tax=Myroides fluvii TaxID=2572594 RepID=UPI00131E3389|nr:TatD family hydrolase [Myroides fluvii]
MKYNIHTHHPTHSADTVEIVNQDVSKVDLSIPQFSLGIHPWYIDENEIDKQLTFIEDNLHHPNCLALGECGLDKKIEIPWALQEEVFVKQLLLAEKNKKAVILHVVSAYQEVIALKKKWKITVPLIVHGFNKHQQVAASLWKNGFYLSFGSALLHNERLQETFCTVPNAFLFLETDDDATTAIAAVYAKATELRPDIAQLVEANFKRIWSKEY